MSGGARKPKTADDALTYYAEWLAKRERRKAECEEHNAAARNRWEIVRVEARSEGVVLAKVVELHEPSGAEYSEAECSGCAAEVSGYEYDMEPWPCATFKLIEDSLS